MQLKQVDAEIRSNIESANIIHVSMVNLILLLLNGLICVEASKSAIFQESVMDIEDLIQLADNFHACAYYIARETLDTRDLIFVPYNYLIDPNTRKSQGIDLADSIVLIDEAHNLEGCATDAYSFTLSSIDIDKAVKDCCSASVLPFSSDVFNSSNVAAPVVDINATKQSLQSLQTKLENLVFSSTTPNSIKSGDYFVQLMKDVDVHNFTSIISVFSYFRRLLLKITQLI